MYGDEHPTQYPSLYSDLIKIITMAYISIFPCSTIKATLSPEPKDILVIFVSSWLLFYFVDVESFPTLEGANVAEETVGRSAMASFILFMFLVYFFAKSELFN